ncbi:MAG: hypothetical protein RMJ43_11230 [Chloroherpetonaceae bacterium]|nr:hypothetical protein [Chthonomonadaceae bacterium]MDW8208401.1 hypothetical protein [Chloroherpetonaceae bacterium]
MDIDFLRALTEVPSVGTACGPVWRLLTARFGDRFTRHCVPDGFCYFAPEGPSGAPVSPSVVFVAHVDEVGGCVLGPCDSGGYHTRFWGNTPDVFAAASLQAWDYLAEEATQAFPVRMEVLQDASETRLILHGENVRPYRTVWTFLEKTVITGDVIEGKALDPRVTVFAVTEAVRALNMPEVGALFVMAEECAMDVARKAVLFLERLCGGCPGTTLRRIINADVPGVQNLEGGQLDLPAIRIYEGRNFIDPACGIRASEAMRARGVAHHLTAARSGSQTLLFTPLAPTLSVALPGEGVHLPRARMSLQGVERCIALLCALAEHALEEGAAL